MSDKRRIPLAEARELAKEVLAIIGVCAARAEIVGSIRRQRADVGDIEIVCIPQYETVKLDLFGVVEKSVDKLTQQVADCLYDGTFAPRLDKNGRVAMGERYRRLFYKGFPLDLFATTPEQWGVIFTIRTGPAEFSHRLVTSRHQGGLLPPHLKVAEGRLVNRNTGIALLTPEEDVVFRAIGLPWIPPEQRTGNERAAVPS